MSPVPLRYGPVRYVCPITVRCHGTLACYKAMDPRFSRVSLFYTPRTLVFLICGDTLYGGSDSNLGKGSFVLKPVRRCRHANSSVVDGGASLFPAIGPFSPMVVREGPVTGGSDQVVIGMLSFGERCRGLDWVNPNRTHSRLHRFVFSLFHRSLCPSNSFDLRLLLPLTHSFHAFAIKFIPYTHLIAPFRFYRGIIVIIALVFSNCVSFQGQGIETKANDKLGTAGCLRHFL